MQSYDVGIRYALESIVRHVIRHAKEHHSLHLRKTPAPLQHKPITTKPRVNLLGLTPLDFAWKTAVPSLKIFLETHGFERGASWTLDTTLEAIEASADADVNLVLTESAVPAAQLLEQELGIPYVAAVPYPPIAEDVAEALHKKRLGYPQSPSPRGLSAKLTGGVPDGQTILPLRDTHHRCAVPLPRRGRLKYESYS